MVAFLTATSTSSTVWGGGPGVGCQESGSLTAMGCQDGAVRPLIGRDAARGALG
jgi:hypothetical protein